MKSAREAWCACGESGTGTQLTPAAQLALAIDNPTFGQIVGREFDPDTVARYNTDEVLAHPPGHMGHDQMTAFNLDAKTRVGEGLGHNALHLQSFFLLVCHKALIKGTDTRRLLTQPVARCRENCLI